MPNARKLAVSALLKVENDSAYSNITLNNIFRTTELSEDDKALATAIFYGVLDRRITLDYVLSGMMKTPIKKVAPFTLQVLRTGLYQIMYMDKIPDSAAVNEAVKLVKGSKENRNAGFVNAVLRNAIRTDITLPRGETKEELSIKYSCPQWIIEGFIKDYGFKNAEMLLEEGLKPAPLVIRVNTVKTNTASLKAELEKMNIPCEECQVENALTLLKGNDISKNTLYKQGLFHVQDTASQKAISVLSPKPGERVLDMCAAPGGKTFTMAGLMGNKGEIVACDLYENRVNLIAGSAKRLGLDIVNTRVSDATVFDSDLGKFDCILCDVPCSGLGIMRRKPEIKYKDVKDFSELTDIQYAILSNAKKYLKPGGRILYSTCTLRKEENENIAKRFLDEYNGFRIMYEHTYMPHIDKTDGFYCALIIND